MDQCPLSSAARKGGFFEEFLPQMARIALTRKRKHLSHPRHPRNPRLIPIFLNFKEFNLDWKRVVNERKNKSTNEK